MKSNSQNKCHLEISGVVEIHTYRNFSVLLITAPTPYLEQRREIMYDNMGLLNITRVGNGWFTGSQPSFELQPRFTEAK